MPPGHSTFSVELPPARQVQAGSLPKTAFPGQGFALTWISEASFHPTPPGCLACSERQPCSQAVTWYPQFDAICKLGETALHSFHQVSDKDVKQDRSKYRYLWYSTFYQPPGREPCLCEPDHLTSISDGWTTRWVDCNSYSVFQWTIYCFM